MIRILAIATSLLLAAAPAAEAGQGRARPALSMLDRCGSGPDGSSNGVVAECLDRATVVEDARMNRAYKAALGRLSKPQQQTLRIAQRAWLKDTDAECRNYSRDQDGAEFVILINDCFYGATRMRANELERYRLTRR